MGVAVKFLVITSKKITGNYPVITNPVFALLPAVNYQPRNPKLPPRAPSFSHFFFGGKERFSPGEAGCNACPSRHAKQALHHPRPRPQVIAGIDHKNFLVLTTLLVNEGNSLCGIHHDKPTPFPALILGQGSSKLCESGWVPCAHGGRLFLADGLFDISYGPLDAVVLDGNIPHGITTLRDFPGQGGVSRPELERFSVIVFSTFAREDIKTPGNYSGMWADWMMPKVVWKSK